MDQTRPRLVGRLRRLSWLWHLIAFLGLFIWICWFLIPNLIGPLPPSRTRDLEIWLPEKLQEVNNFGVVGGPSLLSDSEQLALPVVKKNLRDYRALDSSLKAQYFNWSKGDSPGVIRAEYIGEPFSGSHLVICQVYFQVATFFDGEFPFTYRLDPESWHLTPKGFRVDYRASPHFIEPSFRIIIFVFQLMVWFLVEGCIIYNLKSFLSTRSRDRNRCQSD